jgi:hypothetical protein
MNVQEKIVFFGFDVLLDALDDIAVERAQPFDIDKFVERFITRISYSRVNLCLLEIVDKGVVR